MEQETQQATTQALPERKMIPDAARVEVLKLFGEFLTAQQTAATKRTAFLNFLDVVRKDLGIAGDGNVWVPDDNAYYFEKRGPVMAESLPAQSAAEVPVASA